MVFATDIELTLEDLTSQDIRDISRQTGDLPATFAALKETRSKDIILRAWFEVHEERREQLDPQSLTRRLEAPLSQPVIKILTSTSGSR